MKVNELPGGLWPVMLTPFLGNNEVDIEGLSTLTDFYINAGANGLFANCLSSEMFQLTDHERLSVVQNVIKASDERVPLVASGTFSPDLNQCAEFIKRVYDIGVKAVVVNTNQIVDVDEDDDTFKSRISRLLSITGEIPLGIYECPDPYKRLLSPELMQWLGQTGRFIYHKDTSCDLEAIKNKLKAIKGTELALYNANTTTALESMKSGAKGISPIGANLYPELYTFLIEGLKKNKNDNLLSELNAQLVMMDAIVGQHYPFSAKYFLQKRGLPITIVSRIPSGGIQPENYIKLEALMNVFRQIAVRFDIEIKLS